MRVPTYITKLVLIEYACVQAFYGANDVIQTTIYPLTTPYLHVFWMCLIVGDQKNVFDDQTTFMCKSHMKSLEISCTPWVEFVS